MSFYFPNVDPIYIYKRKGSDEDPFLHLEEERYIKNSSVTLNEVPSHKEEDEVQVFDENNNELIEVTKDTLAVNEFRVDYTTGVVHFNNIMNGKKVLIKYYGTGYVDIPTTRIRIPSSDDDPLETLQDTLDKVEGGIETLEQLGSLEFFDNYDSDYHYKKWNFVNYKGKTYVATQDNIGESPDSSSSWKFVAGGVSVVGVYDSQRTYGINDVVSNAEKTKLYLSRVANNTYPLTNTNAWQTIIDLDNAVDNMVNVIDQQISQLNALKQQLIDSDAQRDIREDEREFIFTDRMSQLELFREDMNDEEEQRQINENKRQVAELARESNENVRQNNEIQRQNNESERQSNEEAREQNFQSAIADTASVINNTEQVIVAASHLIAEMNLLKETTIGVIDDAEIVLDEFEGLRHVGEYDEESTYQRFNIVSHNGSSYIALQETTGDSLDNRDYWQIISLAGRDGTEITIEGIPANEEGDISLESLGLARESSLIELKDDIGSEFNLKVGELSNLRTTRKDSIVDAINELKSRIDDIIDVIS